MIETKIFRGGLATGIVLLLVLMIFSGSASAATNSYDDWEVSGDVAGWRQNTAWTHIEVVDTGGNPDGYLYTRSEGSPSPTGFYAGACSEKAELSGDFTYVTTVQVSFDLNVFTNSLDVNFVNLRFRYHDATQNGWSLLLTTSPNKGVWDTYTISIDPTWSDTDANAAGWKNDGGAPSFTTTMSDVYYTEIRMFGNSAIYAGIDNFRLNMGIMPEDINDYIQDLPDSCFKNDNGNLKIPFKNKLEAVEQMISNGEYADAIDKLENDIKDKVDKWIDCSDAQDDIIEMIDALIAYLQSL